MNAQKTILLLALALTGSHTVAEEQPDSSKQKKSADTLEDIEVVEISPLDGLNLTKDKVPAPVQTATDKDIDKTNAINISDFMNRSLGSVYVNDTQGNGFQPDVNYRGFTASPLAGTPQGLSVYMDGVRLNQPFGDVVSWDLIPRSAIKSMTMMPGSNPLFGRNTLGGALSMETKDGKSNPGTSIQGLGGAYGRNAYEFEHGGFDKKTGLDWFVTGNYYQDQGWRQASPSNVRQIFGKAGWEGEKTDLKLTTAYNDNSLIGNGLQTVDGLKQDYTSVYTRPDITENRSLFLNLEGTYQFNSKIVLAGNTYYRNFKTGTYNGDINGNAQITDLSAFPSFDCISNTSNNRSIDCNGLINQTLTQQQNWGTTGQAIVTDKLFGKDNEFLFGGGYDQSVVGFTQTSQFGYLSSDRNVYGVPSDDINRVSLSGDSITWSFFTQDTFSLTDKLHLTASGRYNYTSISNKDGLIAYGADSLSGKHAFDRFNPAVGLTYNPFEAIGYYAGYNEGTRAPTTVELGCANPDQPCRLPNSMAGDPALKQVITQNWETGFRGLLPGKVSWSLGYFNILNANDIQFVASPTTGYGYFKNFGKTQRQGIEASLDRKVQDWSIGANYTYLDATYQSTDVLNSEFNGAAVDGVITVNPGNHIPLTPKHTFKTYVDYQLTKEWGTNLNVIGFSQSFVRGNENNNQQANGTIPGYVVVNYGLRYHPEYFKGLQIFGQVNNILDEQYYTAGQFGAAGIANGSYQASPSGTTFYGPGAPRTWWLGMRYSF